MRKISSATIDEWRKLAEDFCAQRAITVADVRTGLDAWTAAHVSGICRAAYSDPSIHDAHIQTALEKIFPNAVFRDKKRY